MLLGFITMPLSLANPYLSKLIIDKAYGNKDLKLFLILVVISGSIFLINGAVNALKTYISQRIDRLLRFDLTRDIFKHLQGLSLGFFNDKSTGAHVFRISGDVASVSSFACSSVPQIVILLPRIIFILIIILYLNWKLALFTLFLAPILYINDFYFAKKIRLITWNILERTEGLFNRLHEAFTHMHLVKALGREDFEIDRLDKAFAKRIEAELKSAKLSSIGNFCGSVLNKLIIGLSALYGGLQVINGNLTLGSLTALMIYLTQFVGLVNSIGNIYENIVINSASRERLAEILDTKAEVSDTTDSSDFIISQGKISFDNISFAYKKGHYVLRDLSFSIEPGAKIALVGLSGCGKTTLLSLILRLYNIQNGGIFLDEKDVRDIKLNSLRSQIGIALQEPYLWNDTIVNNILYGCDKAGEEDVIDAAKIAMAHDFITKLPNRYNSHIGEMACKISEGQKQRIAIARAVIKRPKILILDEAMSSLDAQTEDAIIKNIKIHFKDSTVISVSHRLSTIKNMDQVYFLETPSKIDISTHEKLICRNAYYKKFLSSQIERQDQ